MEGILGSNKVNARAPPSETIPKYVPSPLPLHAFCAYRDSLITQFSWNNMVKQNIPEVKLWVRSETHTNHILEY